MECVLRAIPDADAATKAEFFVKASLFHQTEELPVEIC